MAFPQFSRLPAELRIQIWNDSLPDKLGRPIYPWREGCWHWIYPNSDREDVMPELEFGCKLLDNVRLEVPQFFVSCEARMVVTKWVQRQGLRIMFDRERQSLAIVRGFDSNHDTLYVSSDDWVHFTLEPHDRIEELDQFIRIPTPAVKHIALPEELLANSAGLFHDLFDHFRHIQTVFVVKDVPSELEPDQRPGELQDWWELQRTSGEILSWDFEQHEFTPPENDNNIDDQLLYGLIKRASIGMRRERPDGLPPSFEVCPVVAVRR
ncbi:uncharacterized protein BO97DRAFT_408674 [Aspergillus homomorphus CBS 101889]|uniref:2EXR domain-containing protein n=1 Tax=Aspergillus homomorphus (strain CBS 101889) TaxID=1450537 RepID=A0A395HJJ0_ASPHC|nr:hypothetical protein BO97DRAFT_408674 [Aspergillus homomorphus CBS 101889]RAL07940.1 hypothetical protein BO97DRAFT_408674 [Aspergillus homomorphus CBS 101889]